MISYVLYQKEKGDKLKFLNKISDLLFKLFNMILVLVVLGILLFVIQSRIKHLYGVAIDPSLEKGSVYELFSNTIPVPKNKEEKAPPAIPTEMVEVVIPPNTNVNDIGKILKEHGFIQDIPSFVELSKEMIAYPFFKEGTYQIPKEATNKEVIDILTHEEKEKATGTFELTLPGSCTTAQVADILLAQQLIQSKDSFMKEVAKSGAEGKFVPGVHVIHGPIKIADLIQALCSTDKLKPETTETK